MTVDALNVSAWRVSSLLKAMANPHRLMILTQLMRTERSVGELEGMVGLSQSALSQHLARLRRDHLVKTRRSAQTIFYSLAGDEAVTILSTLSQLYSGENGSASTREEHSRAV